MSLQKSSNSLFTLCIVKLFSKLGLLGEDKRTDCFVFFKLVLLSENSCCCNCGCYQSGGSSGIPSKPCSGIAEACSIGMSVFFIGS